MVVHGVVEGWGIFVVVKLEAVLVLHIPVVVVQVFVVFDLVVQNTFAVVVVGSQVVLDVVVFVVVVEQVGSLGRAVVMVVVPKAVGEVACVVVLRVWTAVVFGWC